jgi:hypothetical protein
MSLVFYTWDRLHAPLAKNSLLGSACVVISNLDGRTSCSPSFYISFSLELVALAIGGHDTLRILANSARVSLRRERGE